MVPAGPSWDASRDDSAGNRMQRPVVAPGKTAWHIILHELMQRLLTEINRQLQSLGTSGTSHSHFRKHTGTTSPRAHDDTSPVSARLGDARKTGLPGDSGAPPWGRLLAAVLGGL